jgi:hypothetical protein
VPYIELTDNPDDTDKSEVVFAACAGSGPHASLSSVDPLEKTGLIPYVTRNPADDAGIGLLQPSDVNVDKGTVYTVTFGGTLSAPSGKFSLTFNGQTTIA